MNYRGVSVHWIEEWSQFFTKCNWYTFHPIMIEYEDDACMGGIEATLIILGVGFRIRWNHTETEQVKEIKDLASLFRGDPDD